MTARTKARKADIGIAALAQVLLGRVRWAPLARMEQTPGGIAWFGMDASADNVIAFPCMRAPICRGCGARMRLVRAQLDPSGGRYMFEMFECAACNDRRFNVRPIHYSEVSRVYDFQRMHRFRPTG